MTLQLAIGSPLRLGNTWGEGSQGSCGLEGELLSTLLTPTTSAGTPVTVRTAHESSLSTVGHTASSSPGDSTGRLTPPTAGGATPPGESSEVMIDFLNGLPGDIVNRFLPRFVKMGVTNLHSLSKLSQQQLRDLVPPLGPFRHLYTELQRDWHCRKCGFVNYARYGNAACYRCSHPRTCGASAVPSKDADSNRISAMLHEREQTRRAQDFERADAIREELRAMGVVWDDDMKTWRTPDGRCGRWGTPSHAAAAAGAAQGGYCIKLRGLPFRIRYDDIRNFFALAGIEIVQYSVVLEKNADGRPSGIGYVKVATLEEQQRACAQLNHKHIPGYDRYAWVVESNEAEYQSAKTSWAGAVLSDVPSEGDCLVISQKLKEREECRKLRQYERADAIREALREQGVTFDDELRTWSDRSGNSGRWGTKTPLYSAYNGAGSVSAAATGVPATGTVLGPLVVPPVPSKAATPTQPPLLQKLNLSTGTLSCSGQTVPAPLTVPHSAPAAPLATPAALSLPAFPRPDAAMAFTLCADDKTPDTREQEIVSESSSWRTGDGPSTEGPSHDLLDTDDDKEREDALDALDRVVGPSVQADDVSLSVCPFTDPTLSPSSDEHSERFNVLPAFNSSNVIGRRKIAPVVTNFEDDDQYGCNDEELCFNKNIASILKVCTTPTPKSTASKASRNLPPPSDAFYFASSFNNNHNNIGNSTAGEPLVTRLQSILCAVAESPTSP